MPLFGSAQSTHPPVAGRARPDGPAAPLPVLDAAEWHECGLGLESRGAREQALRAYQRAVACDPDHAAAHTNMGRLHHAAGQLDLAEACYRRAVRLDPEEPVYWFNLGVVLQDRRDLRAALLAYRVALVLQPAMYDAHFNLGRVLESCGDARGALRHLAICRQLAAAQNRSIHPERAAPEEFQPERPIG